MSAFKITGLLLIAAFIFIIIQVYYYAINKQGRRFFINLLYLLTIVYIISQSVFYANSLPDYSPDEMAHISYIYYIKNTGEIIPHFENMNMFSNENAKWTTDCYVYHHDIVNYLCHPPLYYQIMGLVGGINDTESAIVVQIDKMRLRYFSLFIFAIGVCLLLYIGYSRLDKSKPWLHLMYTSSVTCVPIMAFEMCGVTNDSLALVTCCLCAIGLIRFCEAKRNLLTYFLIMFGIATSLLTKMTAATLCILMALIVLIVSIITERSVTKSIKKEFWICAPLLIIPGIYIAIIYSRYGTIQPTLAHIASEEYYRRSFFYTLPESRVSFSFLEYLGTYLNNFFLSWSGLVLEDLVASKVNPFAISTLPMELLWILPSFLFFVKPKHNNSLKLPVLAGWGAMIITFIIQFKNAYGLYLRNGYTGGSQARYYLPLIFALGLGVTLLFESLLKDTGFNSETSETTISNIKEYRRNVLCNELIYLVALAYSLLLFYGNFPFFLLHY